MAFVNMVSELHGSVPKIPMNYCKTLVNRAWRDVRRKNLWSFLLWEDRWTSPGQIITGTASVTLGSTAVVVDVAAAAALNAVALGPPTPLTQRQFRVGVGGIYNIWGWDNPTRTLTLDKPYAEATQVGTAYRVFQCYYPTPMKDFLGWISVRDTTNFTSLFTARKTRAMLDYEDPQRTWYGPCATDVVYFTQDQNSASSTYRFPLFELWGAPLAQLSYQLYGMRRGTDLVLPTDELPPAIGEDCVMALARMYAYEWAEANKGDNPRNSGPDFRFLIGGAQKEYDRLFREYRKDDRETSDQWFSIRHVSLYGKYFAYYSSVSGTAYPGAAI
jgi:hypothetical protein